jgi:hypothetical protein
MRATIVHMIAIIACFSLCVLSVKSQTTYKWNEVRDWRPTIDGGCTSCEVQTLKCEKTVVTSNTVSGGGGDATLKPESGTKTTKTTTTTKILVRRNLLASTSTTVTPDAPHTECDAALGPAARPADRRYCRSTATCTACSSTYFLSKGS